MVSDRCVCWCSRQAALFTSQKAEVGAHQWAHEIRTFPRKNSRASRLGLSSPLEVSLRMVAPALDPGPGLRLLSISRRALAGEQGGGNLSLRPSKSWRRGWGRGGGVGWCVCGGNWFCFGQLAHLPTPLKKLPGQEHLGEQDAVGHRCVCGRWEARLNTALRYPGGRGETGLYS